MGVPYTAGKNEERKSGSGGHTSRGIQPPVDSKRPATSNENTRIGNLGTRTHGMGCDKRKP